MEEEIITKELVDAESLKNEIVVPEFTPTIDKDKTITEQASDVITIMGADRASHNEKFIDKVAESFTKGVLNEQEAMRLKKENLFAEQFFIKWRDVLRLAHITEPQGLGLMKSVVALMILPYFIMRLIGFVFMVISQVFEFFNTLFNSVFGETKEVQLDENGKKIAQKIGYNIFAKIILGFIIANMMLLLIALAIRIFTGFDVFLWLRSITNG